MQFEEQILRKAAQEGSKKVNLVFSKLSGLPTKVYVSKVNKIPLKDCFKFIKFNGGQRIVVYSQILSVTSIRGVAFLTILREDALILVDLLNKQPIGTTGILKNIDRSAIKETLNILSNSYMTSLAENAKVEINVDAPNMITQVRLSDIIGNLLGEKEDGDSYVILFETIIIITSYKIKTNLYLIFNNKLMELVKN